jgi:hypothetical protein
MADSSTGSSRTRLFLFVAVAAVVAGYFLLSPRTENDSDTTPATTRSDVDVAKPGGASTAPSGAPDSMPVPGPESARGADGNDTAGSAPQKRRQSADETGGQALDEARIAIATEPDRKATEAFRARVAAPPPATPEWVVEAIENGPPPVPVEIQEQIALGRPEVPVEMQEAIERTLRDGATPPPPEIQRAIEEAQQR